MTDLLPIIATGLSRMTAMFCLLFTTAHTAHATTLIQLDFDDVVATSELIFEGRVISVEARDTGPRTIHTYVQFEVIDIIKGSYGESTLELRYLGGQVGNRQLEISDMQLPQVGETGFYFVESLLSQQIHPMVGWSQGHYLIQRDHSGVARVQTAGSQPIRDISTLSAGPVPPTVQTRILGHDGSARGVQILQLTDSVETMSADNFRAAVHNIVQTQQAAGR